MEFSSEAILNIQKRIQSRTSIPTTEEATKQWFILPLLVALGYDPYSSDIIPEYTTDVGIKNGEKVDYALQIDDEIVALVECKQFGTFLCDKYVSQLYRYFTVSDAHIAILSNGDDYWFFTDSKKDNIMDLEPYYTVKISTASENDILKLDRYSKARIRETNAKSLASVEKFRQECKEFAHSLKTACIPLWVLDALEERSGISGVDRFKLIEIVSEEVAKEFGKTVDACKENKEIQPINEVSNEASAGSSKVKDGRKFIVDKSAKSNIRLNHFYIYNDYSDGNWKFHTIGEAIILGKKYKDITAKALLLHTVEELNNANKFKRDEIVKDFRFKGNYKISTKADFNGAEYVPCADVYVNTRLSMTDIIRFIEKLLSFCKVPDEQIYISFKD